ncbi:11S globulin seed storage protein 1-like [Rutidosis leptorrhynchoides]|uniref:11S globulin seed storage protein 1-like n=1 Tax=Rutidosis leptorrhynchoides TaxID=125765 RepID=UPI003A995104
MAKLFLSLSFLLLIHGCLARQYQHPLFQQNSECMIQRLDALEPVERVESQAGFTEFFDHNEQQLQCAGVEIIRHTIQPQGLLLPSYTNTPILFYVEQGRGIQGVMLPGCPETFEEPQQLQQFQGRRQGGSPMEDRHQKIHHFIQGDMVAIPTGAAHWLYNDGQDELVIVALLDSTNAQNQLGNEHQRFFLAGNSGNSQQQQFQGRPRSWGRRRQQGIAQQKGSNNIFQGFDVEIIAEAFNVDRETAEMLRCEEDQRGHIVMVERGLQVVSPTSREGQQQEGRSGRGAANGFEETICSMKLRENIDEPSKADIYNPQAGRCTNLNSFKFPILQFLKLSAERGVLYENAIVAPLWTMNAHNIIYVTSGNMRLQIVNDQGEEVFNDQLRERQLVVVPQNFAVVKQAGQQGCKFIKFRTNDNAMINTLAGKNSAMRALPVDVISNAYQMSREEAQRLKYSREETVLFSPQSMSSYGRKME